MFCCSQLRWTLQSLLLVELLSMCRQPSRFYPLHCIVFDAETNRSVQYTKKVLLWRNGWRAKKKDVFVPWSWTEAPHCLSYLFESIKSLYASCLYAIGQNLRFGRQSISLWVFKSFIYRKYMEMDYIAMKCSVTSCK